jgi:hypothetical protein
MIMFLMECDIGYQIILLILRLFCVALFSIDNLSHLYRQCVHAFVRACVRLCMHACALRSAPHTSMFKGPAGFYE